MGDPSGGRRPRRTVVTGLTVALAVATVVAVGYRMLAPAEVSTPARVGYPTAGESPAPGVIGTLGAAPLIVDGRLRVYAAKRQISADARITGKERYTPFWSFRRWPAELTAVVPVDPTRHPALVTRWSDGQLVALDARTGRVRWRATGPRPERGYDGRRTGARTLYDPPGTYLADQVGQPVLIVEGRRELQGLDARTGAPLWRQDVDLNCRSSGLTTGDQLAMVDTCAAPAVVEFRAATTGQAVRRWRPTTGDGTELRLEGVGCSTGRSGCPALRTSGDGAVRGWLAPGPAPGDLPTPVAALDRPGSTLLGRTVLSVTGAEVTAETVTAEPVTGAPGGSAVAVAWRWTGHGPLRLLAAQPGRVHLLDASQTMITLDVRDGGVLSRFELPYRGNRAGWAPGMAYAADGYLAVERLATPLEPAAGDTRYYAEPEPVLFAAT